MSEVRQEALGGSLQLTQIVDAFLQLSTEHGVITACIIFAIGSHYWMIFWLVRKLYNPKNDEIERLVEIRNRFTDKLLGVRLSTKPRKGKKK